MTRATQRRPDAVGDGRNSRAPAVSLAERARLVLQCRARHLGECELDRALSELDLDDDERAAVEALVGRLVAGTLAGPDAALREAETEAAFAAATLALFAEAE